MKYWYVLYHSDLQPVPVELSRLSTDDIDTVMERVLMKQGLNEGDALRNLKSKFNVHKVEYCMYKSLFLHTALSLGTCQRCLIGKYCVEK